MNVLSLFNGISAMHLALDRADIKYDRVYYAEIDKWANKVTEHHFPQDIALGDVTRWREWNIDWSSIGLVGAGFPCQSWSIAGKQLGDKDERGMLFWVTLDIINHVLKHNPNAKFIMENVKMKKEFEDYITHHTFQALGRVDKILINSALVSAQNRNRFYWTNFKIEQPEDKGIMLADVIDDGFTDREKSYCIDANYFKGGNPEQYFNKSRRQLVFYPASIVGRRLNERGVRDDYNKQVPITQCLQVKDKNLKTGCLTTVDKDNIISYENPGRYPDVYNRDDIEYRKLTPNECARLQTFTDDWCSVVSNTQAYKAYGNAWTVDVISHILKFM